MHSFGSENLSDSRHHRRAAVRTASLSFGSWHSASVVPAPRSFPPLVLFDIDGTLHDTMQWWPRVIQQGVRALGDRLGRALPPPDRSTAEAVIGRADAALWKPLLPADAGEHWRELESLTVEIQVRELAGGRDYLFAGTRAMLTELRAAGTRIALASNCQEPYLAAMLDGQGLCTYVDDAWCAGSPGVSTKADMVGFALEAAGTEAAVLVGDRESDAAAAAAHGLPFVHRVGFFAPGDLDAAAVAADQAAILDCLASLAGAAPRKKSR